MKVHGKWLVLCVLPLLVVALTLSIGLAVAQADEKHGDESSGDVLGFEGHHNPTWYLKGSRPFLIGGYGDNFSYDGSRVVPLLGKAKAALDADKDSGSATFTVYGTITPEKGKSYTGEITLYYRVGAGGPAFQEGGVADFIYLHGDTGQDAPVMPKSRTFLASWGEADIYINDKLVYPNLMAHIMFTERARDPQTQAIYNGDRSDFYSPKNPTNGSIVDPGGRELHFVAHSMKEDKGNVPPHSIWLHINFEYASDQTAVHFAKDRFKGGVCDCGCGVAGCGCGGTGGCGNSAVGRTGYGLKGAICGAPGCGCGCNDGGQCGCVGGYRGHGKTGFGYPAMGGPAFRGNSGAVCGCGCGAVGCGCGGTGGCGYSYGSGAGGSGTCGCGVGGGDSPPAQKDAPDFKM